MPRIAIFLHDFAATGVTKNAVAIANACATGDKDVTLVVTYAEGPMAGQVAENVKIHTLLPNRKPLPRPLALTLSLRALARYLKSARPSVFFSAGNHGHFAAITAHTLAGRPCPLVCRFSNDVVRPQGKGLEAFINRAMEGLATGFQRFVVTRADRIITVSEELAHRLRRLTPNYADKITAIRNGIDFPNRASALPVPDHPWMHDRSVPVILGVGRLKAQKNFEGLVQAAAIAARRQPLRLIIIGHGSPAAQQKLLKIAKKEGFDHSLSLPGYQPNPDAYLQHASLFVLSSHWEGAPNVLLEALANGAPIVSTREACGAHEILAGGRFGRLVSSEDIDGMADAIVDALADPQEPAESREKWLGEFARDRMLAAYMAALVQVAAPGALHMAETDGLENPSEIFHSAER